MYWTGKSMNNLLSYFGLVDARIRASNKDLPVINTHWHQKRAFSKSCLHNLKLTQFGGTFTKSFKLTSAEWFGKITTKLSQLTLSLPVVRHFVKNARKNFAFELVIWFQPRGHTVYRTRAIITRSWFETALDYKPRILDPTFLVYVLK